VAVDVDEAVAVTETAVTELPLAGPLADRNAELSGLAWYGDMLILLPQFPDFNGHDPALYALPKADIAAYLAGETAVPLQPIAIPLDTANLEDDIRGYEGFEAIAFDGQTIYLTIEAAGSGMRGYLVRGTIAPDLSGVTLEPEPLMQIEPQANLGNMADEALLLVDDHLLTFYEANGAEVNPQPVAHRFTADLATAGTLPMPTLPYRLTDVTELDANGRFWGINYKFTDTRSIQTDNDPLAAQYGQGSTHAQNEGVERLVAFDYSADGITLAPVAPIQLQLLGDDQLRNWEGIVMLDEQGFLLATDKFPQTILAFVPTTDN
jgi:hypothetical protein